MLKILFTGRGEAKLVLLRAGHFITLRRRAPPEHVGKKNCHGATKFYELNNKHVENIRKILNGCQPIDE